MQQNPFAYGLALVGDWLASPLGMLVLAMFLLLVGVPLLRRVGAVRHLVWRGLTLLPAAALALVGMATAAFWTPARWFGRVVPLERAAQSVAARALGRAAAAGRRVGDPLLAGNIEAAQEKFWPRATYPELYARVPDDLHQPVWRDGRLPGGKALTWLADRHMTGPLIARSVSVGTTAAIGASLALLAAWVAWTAFALGDGTAWPARQVIEQLPGDAPTLTPWAWSAQAVAGAAAGAVYDLGLRLAGLAAALALGALGLWMLATTAATRRVFGHMAEPYRMPSKDSEVRWAQRAETRALVEKTYRRQVALATGHLADQPLYTLGQASGLIRLRGDLMAPEPGQAVALDGEALSQHLLILGATGEGKTSAILRPLMRQLFGERHRGAYVTDAKGVLWGDALQIARACGREQDVVVVGTGEEHAGVDTLHGLSPNTVAAVCKSVLAQVSGGGNAGDFWDESAANLIRYVAAVARAYEATPEGRESIARERVRPYSLWWIYRAILEDERLEGAIEAVLAGLRDPERRAAYGRGYSTVETRASIDYLTGKWRSMAPNTQSGIVATVSRLLDGFVGANRLRERFATGVGRNMVALDEATRGRLVLVALSTVEDGLPARLVAVLLKTTLYRAARLREARIGSAACQARPVAFISDEFQEIATADPSSGLSDTSFWNVARSTGLSGIFATQTIAALVQSLGDRGCDNFLQQARSKIFLRSEDKATIEYACWLVGEHQRARVVDDWRRESIEHRAALDGWSPLAPVDLPPETEMRGILLSATRDLWSAWNAGPQAAVARASVEVDTRFVPRSSFGGDRTQEMQAEQAAHWRAEDLERAHRQHGNDREAALTPADVIQFGRYHAFAHVQRAGGARQDVIDIKHDFGGQ